MRKIIVLLEISTSQPSDSSKKISRFSLQDGREICPQEVRQDDEDLQPRQGLQEEQQVWILLKS